MGTLLLTIIFFTFLGFAIPFFLFKRKQAAKSPFTNPLYWLSSFLLTPLLFVASNYAYLYLSSRYEEKTFDQVVWLEKDYERYVFVDDLVDNKKLLGLDSLSVIVMLGEPSYEEEGSLIYDIGYDPKHYFNMDPDYLVIGLEEGKVKHVNILL